MRFWLFLPLLFVLIATEPTFGEDIGCLEDGGNTFRADYYADTIQTRMYYTVYLPPCYDESTALYPVLYLMHGSNEDDGQWLRLGLRDALDSGIRSGDLPPIVVVMPFGNWIANENRFDANSWAHVFTNQLMPLVESEHRVSDRRGIGGISRGGFWAFHLALKSPELFDVLGGHSAFFDEHHADPDDNPLDLILNADGVETLRIGLDRGVDDFAAPGLDLMGNRLNERGLAHDYIIHSQGEHNNAYWRQHVPEYLRFYTAGWRDSTDDSTMEETAVQEGEPRPTSIFITSTPRPLTPAPTVTPEPEASVSYYLLLPTVAFPSFQPGISRERLDAIRGGEHDPALVLTDEVAEILRAEGITISPQTRIIAAGQLYNTLWSDRRLFTLMPFDDLMPRFRVLDVDESHPLDVDLDDYPFAFASQTPNYHPERLTRVVLSGVTALTRATKRVLDQNGIEWAASGIVPYVSQADFFHTSNEVSIYPTCPQTSGPTLGGSFSFCSKQEHFDLFELIGLDIVELSGNHNNDYGYDAYFDTLDWYEERDIMTVGGGRTLEEARSPLILDHHGNSIAMVACNWVGPYYAIVNEDPSLAGGIRPGAAFCDVDWLRETLPALSDEHDLVIVTIQYLEKDEYTPTDEQRSDFRFLAQLGADIVMGTSSHFPQTYEFFPQSRGESFIHYGMGNLFFDQTFLGGRRFFMNQLFVYEGRLLTVDPFTGLIDGMGRPRPMTPGERENFLFLMMNEYGGF